MTAADFLARIEARANAATEGPWETEAWSLGETLNDARGFGLIHDDDGAVPCLDVADAEFIAHARTDVPALVAALRAVLDLHKPGVGASQGYLPGGDYGYVEPYCEGCVHSDEYAQQWPCQTARAVATALGVSPS